MNNDLAEKREEKIKEIKKREAEDLAQILSQKYRLPYLDLSRITVEIDALKIVPEKEARAGQLAVFQKVGKKISIAVKNPEFPSTKSVLENLKKELYQSQLFLVSENSLKRAWGKYEEIPKFEAVSAGLINISPKNLETYLEEIKNISDLRKILTPFFSAKAGQKISSIAEAMLAGAYALEASDIHLEPQEEQVRLRFRLDGMLYDLIDFSLPIYRLLLSRLKLIAKLKLNVSDRAQDGRFTIKIKDLDVEVRVSALPSAYGESIVMRILHPKAISVSFENLGMQENLLKMMEKEIKRPNGMILTTGPTGSGKTTTLYAFIKKVFTPGVKIITIENPIEYHIQGISQSQVNPEKDYDFAAALRAILRQDPDIILVGEIRDLETARTALNAALTGHLVFSTLHTNNAFGTIPRLIDIGAKPNIVAPAITVAMAQRLIRTLCQQCKKKVKADAEEKARLEKTLADLPAAIKKPDLKNLFLFKAAGCETCNQTGYKGRIGVFEAFRVDDETERVILGPLPLESEFKKIAQKQGMMTMNQDAVFKVLAGKSSLEELERVLG